MGPLSPFLLFRRNEPFRILFVTPFEDRTVSSALPFPAGILSIGSSIRLWLSAVYMVRVGCWFSFGFWRAIQGVLCRFDGLKRISGDMAYVKWHDKPN
jgi:hypothetical protein